MIFAETKRLKLRALRPDDLPRYAELINDWEVAKWLVRVPHPYTLKDAEWWLEKMTPSYRAGKPELFVIADKAEDQVMGAIGLHEPYVSNPQPGEVTLGYWLGKPFWRHGFMSEAVPPVLNLAFTRPDILKVSVFTDIDNLASQNVLRKAGFRYLGTGPRVETGCLRGSEEVTRWEMIRKS